MHNNTRTCVVSCWYLLKYGNNISGQRHCPLCFVDEKFKQITQDLVYKILFLSLICQNWGLVKLVRNLSTYTYSKNIS